MLAGYFNVFHLIMGDFKSCNTTCVMVLYLKTAILGLLDRMQAALQQRSMRNKITWNRKLCNTGVLISP